ncbi:hypothetical protein PICSAR25_04126 [Mycobacterium avium subsp. paratuberculosis]|nr:hypothetical protein PICSAR25_04126 [Mycobacterium avium subsp. paratuberculosis]
MDAVAQQPQPHLQRGLRQQGQLGGVHLLGDGGGAVVAGVRPQVPQQRHRPSRGHRLGDRAERPARQRRLTERQRIADLGPAHQGVAGDGVLVPAGQLGGGDHVDRHPDIGPVAEHRDGPAVPFLADRAAQREHPAQHPARGAQPAQLDVERDRGERPGQRLGERSGRKHREPRIDPVVEFAFHAFGRRAVRAVARPLRQHLDGQRELGAVIDRARGVQPAPDQPTRGVGDRVQRVPAELEQPILLRSSNIEIRNQLRPAAHPVQPGTGVGGAQHPPGGDQVDGVRAGQVHHAGAVGVEGRHQKAHQVVEVQHPHRLRRHLGAQHGGHRAAHHPVELTTDRRRDPDHHAGPPARGHQVLGRSIQLGPAGGLRHEQQPGPGPGGGVGDARQPVHGGVAGRGGVDRGQVDDRVGLVGQLAQHPVAQRRANEFDVAVQAGVRQLSNSGDGVPGRDQLPSDQPPECAGGVGNQDVHLGSPPPTLSTQQ